LPSQPGDVERTWADVGRARSLIGYDPRVPVEDGIRRFIDWYREERTAA
jgi:UDP-glucuronate 4-epimerase